MQILGSLAKSDSTGLWDHGSFPSSPGLSPPYPPAHSTDSPLHLSSTTVSPTLIRLCSLWPYIHSPPTPSPPDICNGVTTTFTFRNADHLGDSGSFPGFTSPRRNGAGTGERMVGIDSVQELTFSGRSFSLMGVLGGVLFILLVIAFITCIRHRKRVRSEADGELDLDMISSRIRRIHQARASHHLLRVLNTMPETPPAPPPDYDTVLKQREKEELDLPSYLEAIGAEANEQPPSSSSSSNGCHSLSSCPTNSQQLTAQDRDPHRNSHPGEQSFIAHARSRNSSREHEVTVIVQGQPPHEHSSNNSQIKSAAFSVKSSLK